MKETTVAPGVDPVDHLLQCHVAVWMRWAKDPAHLLDDGDGWPDFAHQLEGSVGDWKSRMKANILVAGALSHEGEGLAWRSRHKDVDGRSRSCDRPPPIVKLVDHRRVDIVSLQELPAGVGSVGCADDSVFDSQGLLRQAFTRTGKRSRGANKRQRNTEQKSRRANMIQQRPGHSKGKYAGELYDSMTEQSYRAES